MHCRHFLFGLTLLAPVLVAGSARADLAPILEWQAPLSSCFPEDLVLDDAGNSYVACRDPDTRSARVVAYDPDGGLIAQTTLPVERDTTSIPVDLAWGQDQLYVAVNSVRSTSRDAVVYALAPADLAQRWRASRASATAVGLATTAAGGVWLGATSSGGSRDLLLSSYTARGVVQANRRYDSGHDDAFGGDKRSLAADRAGNLYVAAGTALLRFNASGALAWRVEQPTYAVRVDARDHVLTTTPLLPAGQTARFSPDGRRDFLVAQGGFDVAVAPSGQIWIGGTRVTDDARGWDLLTTLLEPDGRVVFTDRYDGGNQDRFVDLGVDASGAAFVLASTFVRAGLFGTSERYLVVKYTAADRRAWTQRYGVNGLPAAVGVSPDGRVVATGHDGTASWVDEESEPLCWWWWPSCWGH